MPKKTVPKKALSRAQTRDLDIEIGFLEGVLRRDPTYVDALQVLGDDYTSRGQFAEGLKVDEKLAELKPSDSMVFYNLACSYSLTGKLEEAADALDRAISLGYRDFKWLAEDPDLADLRRHNRYRQIRAKIRSLRVKIS